MVQGMTARAQIIRWMQGADTEAGQAQATGVLVYECVASAFNVREPTLMSLEQGLEIKKIGECLVQPATMLIYERDEFQITSPPDHPRLGERWRIISVHQTPLMPSNSRSMIKLKMERWDENRTVQ